MAEKWLQKLHQKDRDQWLAARSQIDLELHDKVALGVCFSEERDLLSQWRGYADNGSGFSITFDKGKLEKAIRKNKETLDLIQISYVDTYEHAERVSEICRGLYDAFGPVTV